MSGYDFEGESLRRMNECFQRREMAETVKRYAPVVRNASDNMAKSAQKQSGGFAATLLIGAGILSALAGLGE